MAIQSHPTGRLSLLFQGRNVAGSLIGGIAETREMLDYCAEHDITADVEVIAMKDINQDYQRMEKSDVKCRFVIDMAYSIKVKRSKSIRPPQFQQTKRR